MRFLKSFAYSTCQRGQGTVQSRQQATLERGEIVVVRVPVAMVDGHAAHAGFHQAARRQEIVIQQRAGVAIAGGFRRAAAIAVAQPQIFPIQVQRLGQPVRRQNAQRLLGERIESRPRSCSRNASKLSHSMT